MKNVAQSLDRRERGWEGGGRGSPGEGHGWASAPRWKEACSCLWLQTAGDSSCQRGPLPASQGLRARSSPRPRPCLLCTRTSPRQKQLEVGPRLGDDPRANRKTAFASWTIYGGCLKHRCFGDARYSEYSLEESILCTRRVLC